MDILDANPEKVFSYQSNSWHDLEDYSALKEKNNSLQIQKQKSRKLPGANEIQKTTVLHGYQQFKGSSGMLFGIYQIIEPEVQQLD